MTLVVTANDARHGLLEHTRVRPHTFIHTHTHVDTQIHSLLDLLNEPQSN